MITTKKEFNQKIQILTNKLKVGLFDEVIFDAKRLLKVSKDQILFNILSIAHQSKGDYDESIKIMNIALKLKPKNIYFLNNLGLSYFKKGDLKNAEFFYSQAIKINPDYLNILNNYGNLKKELDSHKEAIEYFNKAILLDENSLEANYNLALVYQAMGDYNSAIKFFEKALSIKPNFTKIDRNIASMTNYTLDNKHFISMKEKIKHTNLNNYQKLELHFALGKAFESIKDYKNSFKNIDYANVLMKNFTNYNIHKDEQLFKNIKKTFENKNYTPAKPNKIKTIFILGMPRSGTSIVEQIISSHPMVFGGGELIYLNQIIDEKFLSKSNVFENMSKIFNEAQTEYLEKISLKNKNNLSFTDKSPLNFRWIGFILNMLPNSKIIHCRRNKLDVCWSNYKNQFEGSLYFSNNFKDLSEYYAMYEDLMKFWKEKFPNQIYDLDHDKLISNSKTTIKKLITFCDLEWNDKCLKPEENKRAVKTVSFKQARSPIYKEKVKNCLLYDKYLDELKEYLSNNTNV